MSFNKRMLSPGGSPFVASEHFKVVTWSGTGSDQTITVGFQPDLVIYKERSSTSYWHAFDSIRGATKYLEPNTAAVEGTCAQCLKSFTSTGFTVGNDGGTNDSGQTYVAYCWKAKGGTTTTNTTGSLNSTIQANGDNGFSIIKYTSDGSTSSTVGHGMGQVPDLMIAKAYETYQNYWTIYHHSLASHGTLYLNNTDAVGAAQFGTPSSTVFTTAHVGTSGDGNARNYITYAWKEIDGFSKFGSYTGDGDDNGPIVETGFEPAMVMIKRSSSTGNWLLHDNKRTSSASPHKLLFPNDEAAEQDKPYVNFLSNGFQIIDASGQTGDTNYNLSGSTYVYMAWAADPDEDAPTLASSFSIETYKGNDNNDRSYTGLGFEPDLVWIKRKASGTESHALYDSLTGPNNQLSPDTDAAIAVNSGDYLGLSSFDSDGFTLGNNGGTNRDPHTYAAWAWKADDNEPTYNTNGSINSLVSVNANAGFSIVKYTGTGSNATIGHGLSSAPTFIIVKALVATANSNWAVYHTSIGNTKALILSTNAAEDANAGYWNNTSPTSTVFTVGTYSVVNESSDDYIAYCFHDVTGYSKFGGYTSNASTKITTGFKPDWMLFKYRTSGDWYIQHTLQTESKIGSADSGDLIKKYFVPNTNAAEASVGTGGVEVVSDGFYPTNWFDTTNGFIYAAFKQNVTSNTTLANSFNIKTWTGTASAKSITGLGFRPDLVWIKSRSHTTSHELNDDLRGQPSRLTTDTDAAAATSYNGFLSLDSDGFSLDGAGSGGEVNANARTYVGWAWKAGNAWQHNIDGALASIINVNTANGFSIVKYTGDATNGRTVGHGLGATPEVIFVKNIDAQAAFAVYHGHNTANPETERLKLDTNDATMDTPNYFNDTAPTSSVFTIGTEAAVNTNNQEYIAYCWAPKSGFSKFGTYTGNGSTQSITGVGFKPDLILFKKTNATQDWLMVDSKRGGQKELVPSGSAAEYTMSNGVSSFDSDGWSMGANNSLNTNSATYVYMAFKTNLTGVMSWLVVGGGGSGSGGYADSYGGIGGAGAGAGGLRTSYGIISGGGGDPENDITLAAGTYTVTIGAGGAANSSTGFYAVGNHGNDSSLAGPSLTTITSLKGGRGGSRLSNAGGGGDGTYGSGGAHATDYTSENSTNAGTAGQGFASGGTANSGGSPATRSSSGGGGAGGAGVKAGWDGPGENGGTGGAGLSVSITGSSVGYAGGGGGGAGNTSSGVPGGVGSSGGGSGGATHGGAAGSGTANTGGGGGGGGGGTSASGSGAGGSGVVILRLLTSEYSGSTTGSPTVTTDGDYTVIKYTSSGTYVHS